MSEKLYEEWKNTAKQLNVEKYSIAISQIISWYKDGVLEISPVYQRFYRWSNEQKSELIETLLLGLPIPPIFVYKNSESKIQSLEIMDGLQRIATILEFTRNLNKFNEENKKEKVYIEPKEKLAKLEKTPFLKTLGGNDWDDFINEGLDFTILSRSLDFVVLDSIKNDKSLKYKIFRRLNKSATNLEPQEIRNATIAEIDDELYKKMVKYFSDKLNMSFLSEKDISERKDMELFIMFLLIKYYLIDSKKIIELKENSSNFSTLLDCFTDILFDNKIFLENGLKEFEIFIEICKEFGFKKYDEKTKKYKGLFINAFFEIAATIYFKNKQLLLNEEFIIRTFSISYAEWQKKVKCNNPPAIIRIFKSIDYAMEIAKNGKE